MSTNSVNLVFKPCHYLAAVNHRIFLCEMVATLAIIGMGLLSSQPPMTKCKVLLNIRR
eukprot:gene9066-6516_t